MGFLPCSRCSPARNAETIAESCVKGVIRHIEMHFDEPTTLHRLSQRTGLSANYLQRAFQQIVGVTPKRYSDTRRIDGFKLHLKLGESIASSGYRVGYGSSRAVYAHTKHHLGMTPAAYQRGGAMRVRFAFVGAGRNHVLLAETRAGLCAVLQGPRRGKLLQELQREYPRAAFVREREPPLEWVAAVRKCEQEDPFVTRLPSACRRRIFRARVIDLLRGTAPAGTAPAGTARF
jgi:AraC family transcriptional regulator of adaptative response/methylated-DNA-[protein]-cysteine methyltransferase